jgi:hypothetical protein
MHIAMLSESARMSSAAEARFRVQGPNSMPRTIKVIALDSAAEAVIRRLAGAGWHHATFFTAVSPSDSLCDLAGRRTSIREEVDAADLIVLVAGPGGHAHATPAIGQACSHRRVMTTGFVVGATSAPEREVASTLAQLRPWSLRIVMASSDEFIDDMMTALRA